MSNFFWRLAYLSPSVVIFQYFCWNKNFIDFLPYSYLDSHMVMMTETSYSIAHTKNHLPVLVHSLENTPVIPITRRGKVVAYLLSTREYDSLKGNRKSFTEALKTLRASDEFKKNSFSDKDFANLRDTTKDREVIF
ncbi:MAG: type II toxin-antitoxin system Phd/YefM family antitoxin [Leptospiraceae bacterium]|nr:type II toxin-antitoxin system Phd/YefM family antitoxin [Leptospiraceae bacterium]